MSGPYLNEDSWHKAAKSMVLSYNARVPKSHATVTVLRCKGIDLYAQCDVFCLKREYLCSMRESP